MWKGRFTISTSLADELGTFTFLSGRVNLNELACQLLCDLPSLTAVSSSAYRSLKLLSLTLTHTSGKGPCGFMPLFSMTPVAASHVGRFQFKTK